MLRKVKNRVSGIGYRVSLAILSAGLLTFSFPPFNIWIFAWFAFIPLFFAIEGLKPLRAFLLSYLTGFLFFLGTMYWLIHVTLPGMVIVVAYLALYFGFFGLIIRNPIPDTQYSILFLIPAAWTALEWIRAHALTGFGWQSLGYSQSFNLPVIQIADVAGVYGVSFIVVMFNTAVYLSARNFRKKSDALIPLFMAAILTVVISGYGLLRLNNIFTGERLKVAVVQGNIPQDEKWKEGLAVNIMDKYKALTAEASLEKPDLIIWPETSVPGFVEAEKVLCERVRSLAAKAGSPLLVGAPRFEGTGKGDIYYNSTYLFSKDGEIAGRYDKMHLVPFGEYVPLKDLFFFVHKFAPRPIGDFAAGKENTVFRFFVRRVSKGENYSYSMLKKVGFSTLICFEDIFPEISREFVKRGALFLVNMTNDAWFNRSAAAYQHAQNSVFRAVENRTNVIRAANTGLSCFIDQKGRITAKVEKGSKDLFVDGFKVSEIVLSRTRTVYNIYGDIFAYICIFFTALYLTRTLRRSSA